MARSQDPEKRRVIGINLSVARKLAGYSQADVMSAIWSEKDPKQKNRISDIESGRTLPDAELLQQLCKLYGVSADYILGFSVESDIDATAGRAGYMYNGMKEIMGDLLQTLSLQISQASAEYIQVMPKPHMLALLDQSKRVVRAYADCQNKMTPAMVEELSSMRAITRECDQHIAIQMRGYEMALNEAVERPDKDDNHQLISDGIEKRLLSRYPATVLPKADAKLHLKTTNQQSLFMVNGECRAFPQTDIEG